MKGKKCKKHVEKRVLCINTSLVYFYHVECLLCGKIRTEKA